MLVENLASNCRGKGGRELGERNILASAALAAVFGLPGFAVADHVPDNLSQDLNPNYIACLMAVDDAETEFRDTLQSTCLHRVGDICSGRNGIALPSQVIECLYFETQRGIEFLQIATRDLPESVEKKGLFGHGYKRRRDGILKDTKTLKNLPEPASIKDAVEQFSTMASAATTLLWLARETGTQVEAHAFAPFGRH